MQTYLEDRLQITDLITGWIHRDLGQWDQLANLAHPDGTLRVTTPTSGVLGAAVCSGSLHPASNSTAKGRAR